MIKTKIKYKLKGHSSFVIREGWLNKALYHVNQDNNIFRDKKAADLFGVGSNMAIAIKYWLNACDLMCETKKEGAKLSNLGKIIYESDPYFEDVFTLWILHCNLAMNRELATSWYLFFNKCEADEYTREELGIQMERNLGELLGDDNYSKASLKDDIAAITNMYAKNRNEDSDPEDNNISPFTMLGLIKENNYHYTKVQPNLDILDDKVILYLLFKQIGGQQSISIDELQHGANSVSRILNLTRITLNQFLDKLDNQGYIQINRTAGLDVVYKISDFTPLDVVREYYGNVIN